MKLLQSTDLGEPHTYACCSTQWKRLPRCHQLNEPSCSECVSRINTFGSPTGELTSEAELRVEVAIVAFPRKLPFANQRRRSRFSFLYFCYLSTIQARQLQWLCANDHGASKRAVGAADRIMSSGICTVIGIKQYFCERQHHYHQCPDWRTGVYCAPLKCTRILTFWLAKWHVFYVLFFSRWSFNMDKPQQLRSQPVTMLLAQLRWWWAQCKRW